MYHIFASQRHRQDGAGQGKYQAPLEAAVHRAADAPRLVEAAVAVLAGVGGVNQQMDLARARRLLDALAAGQQRAAARFEPEAVERGLLQRGLDPLAEIIGNGEVGGLEGAGERALELALGLRGFELGPADADPRPAAVGAGADVGRDLAVGAKRQANEVVTRRGAAREDAGPLARLGVEDALADIPHLNEKMLVTLGKAGIKTLDDLADLATDELIQKKRPEPRRRAEGTSQRTEDKGGILADYGLSEEQGNEIIMAARAHWFEDEAPASGEDAVAETPE